MSEYNPKEVFEKKTGITWLNSQDEPDIDYVNYLEKQNKQMAEKIIKLYNCVRTIDVGGFDDYSPNELKEFIESITGKSIDEAIK